MAFQKMIEYFPGLILQNVGRTIRRKRMQRLTQIVIAVKVTFASLPLFTCSAKELLNKFCYESETILPCFVK